MPAVAFTKMTPADLEAVMAIEREAFSSPWTEGMFRAELFDNPFSFSLVMKQNQEIAGYLVYWEVVDEFHLMNFAVSAKWRRLGMGAAGMQWIKSQGREKGIRRITLEMRASNTTARVFYRTCGFHHVGTRKRYYDAPVEDALLLQYDFLPPATPTP